MTVDPREELGVQYVGMVDDLQASVSPVLERLAKQVAASYVQVLNAQAASTPVTQLELNQLRLLWDEASPAVVPLLVDAYEAGYVEAADDAPSQEQREAFTSSITQMLASVGDTLVKEATEDARVGGRAKLLEGFSAFI